MMVGKKKATQTETKNNGAVEAEAPNGVPPLQMSIEPFLRMLVSSDGPANTLGVTVSQERLLQLLTAANEAPKYKDLVLRTRADLANYQKRVARDAEENRDRKLRELFEGSIPILEAFFLAFNPAANNGNGDSYLDGLKMAFDQLINLFSSYGLERIETESAVFDPNLHEVVDARESSELPNHSIISELRPGFRFKGRTLRPSQVIVSTKPKNSTEDASEVKEDK